MYGQAQITIGSSIRRACQEAFSGWLRPRVLTKDFDDQDFHEKGRILGVRESSATPHDAHAEPADNITFIRAPCTTAMPIVASFEVGF